MFLMVLQTDARSSPDPHGEGEGGTMVGTGERGVLRDGWGWLFPS